LAAWHIEQGHFTNRTNNKTNGNDKDGINSINLANLNVILAVHAPGHMFTGPKCKLALYLDERANNNQKDALTEIFTGQVGGETFCLAFTSDRRNIRNKISSHRL
jgi:hypothetical protein